MMITQSTKGLAVAIAAILLAALALHIPVAKERAGSLNPDLAAFSPLRQPGRSVKTRVCLNMIVRNEENDLIKFLRTVKDHITNYILCDTGSTDNTVDLAREFFTSVGLNNGVIEHYTFLNFADSRNLCLNAAVEKMGSECDFWLILEPDHVFVSSRGILLPSIDLFNHSSYYVEERNLGTIYNTRRLVSTKLRWYYVGAVHEFITVDNDEAFVDVASLPQGIYAEHNIRFSVEKYITYRDMLENEVRKHPDDPRLRYYLGQTYAVLQNSDKAIMSWLARIQMGTFWVEEQYMAALNLANELAKIYDKSSAKISEETQEALIPWVQMRSTQPTAENLLAVFFRASHLLPYRHEAWYYIAKIYRSGFSNYAKCYEYAKKASQAGPHTADTLFSHGVIIDFHIDDELCICGHYVHDLSGGEACKRVIAKISELKEPEEWQTEIKSRSIVNLAHYSTDKAVRAPNIDGKTRVIFHSHQLGNRGTEVSLFDYGMWLEIFYLAEAHFAFPYPGWTPIMESPFKKFTTTFPGRIHLVFADNMDYPLYRKTLDNIVMAVGAQYLYRQELQNPLYEVSTLVPTLIHEVFNCSISRKMGAKYKAISPFVQTQLGDACTGNVPYMVWLPRCSVNARSDLRRELGISEDVFVFAWYGGHDAWDPAATEIVRKVAVARATNVVFLLQNFPPLQFLKIGHLKNVILVPSTSSMLHKCRFIETADAFLHTRLLGETFGLAVAEFSLRGKPTITNVNSPHRFHLETLGNNTFIYRTYGELEQILMLLDREKVLQFFPLTVTNDKGQSQLFSLYSEFSPCKVMKNFNEEFFDGKLVPRDGGAVLDKFCSSNNTQLIDVEELKAVYGIDLF